jgi:Tol biopolymer transport system component
VNHSPGLDGTSNTIAFGRWVGEGQTINNGAMVVFDSEIFTVGVDGTSERQVTSAGGSNGWPSWSPDGRQIVFRSTPSGTDGNASDMAVVTVADQKVRVIAHEAWSPAWSPKGDWIAYYAASKQFGLNLIRPDGSDDHQILSGDAEYPTWSPDGRRLAFMSLGFPAGRTSAAYEIYVVDVDGQNLQRLTNVTGEDGYPAWSHDGTRIVYQRNPTEPESEIHVMSADGQDDQLISDVTDNLEESAPSWSPTDLYIAYQAYPQTELTSGGIFVMRPDGSGRLMIRPDGFEPEWQPIH